MNHRFAGARKLNEGRQAVDDRVYCLALTSVAYLLDVTIYASLHGRRDLADGHIQFVGRDCVTRSIEEGPSEQQLRFVADSTQEFRDLPCVGFAVRESGNLQVLKFIDPNHQCKILVCRVHCDRIHTSQTRNLASRRRSC